MRAGSEAAITARIRRGLEARGAYVYKAHGGPMGRVGTPDLLVCYEGRFYALEVKVPGNKPTVAQAKQLEVIRAAGGVAAVVHGPEEALAVLRI